MFGKLELEGSGLCFSVNRTRNHLPVRRQPDNQKTEAKLGRNSDQVVPTHLCKRVVILVQADLGLSKTLLWAGFSHAIVC